MGLPHRRRALRFYHVLPATSMHLHPPFPVSVLPTGASTNRLVQPLSSEKSKNSLTLIPVSPQS